MIKVLVIGDELKMLLILMLMGLSQ